MTAEDLHNSADLVRIRLKSFATNKKKLEIFSLLCSKMELDAIADKLGTKRKTFDVEAKWFYDLFEIEKGNKRNQLTQSVWPIYQKMLTDGSLAVGAASSDPVSPSDQFTPPPLPRTSDLQVWFQSLGRMTAVGLIVIALLSGVCVGAGAFALISGNQSASPIPASSLSSSATSTALTNAAAIPATLTSTAAGIPRDTPTSSNTVIPSATATSTQLPPTASATPLPPTLTATPLPPTATPPPPNASGPVDLTGKVPSDIPGIRIAPGFPVTSVVDKYTKIRDVYALQLFAGKDVRFGIIIHTGNQVYIMLYYPGTKELGAQETRYALSDRIYNNWKQNFTPATDGIYYFSVSGEESGTRYSLTVTEVN